jgi:hypothetical protein
MGSNKITTVSYFIKRLRDSGYLTNRLYTDYAKSDARSWTVVIDPKATSVFITCFNNHNFFGEEYFVLDDGGQFIPEKFKLKTSSIEVIIEYLSKYNINNKYKNYSKPIEPKINGA